MAHFVSTAQEPPARMWREGKQQDVLCRGALPGNTWLSLGLAPESPQHLDMGPESSQVQVTTWIKPIALGCYGIVIILSIKFNSY